MVFELESIENYLPHYLTDKDRRTLLDELKAFSSGSRTINYILGAYHGAKFQDQMLQGDGWNGFQLFDFGTGKLCSVSGLVLSNSCDIDSENPRSLPIRVIFAPLIKFAKYKELLRKSGIGSDSVEDKINSIKAQTTSNIFYLPAGGAVTEDYIVRLDDIHSMPIEKYISNPNKTKLFTLNNTGFYLLIFKLSVHLCRLQENINRNTDVPS